MTKRQHLRLLKLNGEMQPYPIKNAEKSQGGRTINMRTPWYVRMMAARYPYDLNNLALAARMPKGLRFTLFLSQNYHNKTVR